MEETWKNAHYKFNWDCPPREGEGGKEERETSQGLAEENPSSLSLNR